MFSYFRTHYADHYTQLCLDMMQGQSIDSDNLLITLVDSVASPLLDQINPSNYPVTLSSEHFVFSNELRVTEFVFLLSRLVVFEFTTRFIAFHFTLNYQRNRERVMRILTCACILVPFSPQAVWMSIASFLHFRTHWVCLHFFRFLDYLWKLFSLSCPLSSRFLIFIQGFQVRIRILK